MILVLLVSIAVIPIMGLFPFGRLALKQAEDLQTAVFLAHRSMSEARASVAGSLTNPDADPTTPDHHAVATETLNGVIYTVARDIYSVRDEADPTDSSVRNVVLMDVVVAVSWDTARAPLRCSTRLYRNYLDLQKNLNVDTMEAPE